MTTDPNQKLNTKSMSIFERYLTVWIGLCIVGGIALGKLAPSVAKALDGMALPPRQILIVPTRVIAEHTRAPETAELEPDVDENCLWVTVEAEGSEAENCFLAASVRLPFSKAETIMKRSGDRFRIQFSKNYF